jgi:uncharacterized protein YfiM (DUF2279 family)
MRRGVFTAAMAAVFVVFWWHLVLAGSHKSDLGYTIIVPDGWVVYDKANVKERPAMIEAAVDAAQKDQGLSKLPERMVAEISEMVLGGRMDYYYSGSEPRFTVSVYRGAGEVPKSEAELSSFCKSLPEELSKHADHAVQVHQCRLADIVGHQVLYLVADDYWKGKRYIQYHIQRGSDEILFFTASSNSKDFDEMSGEFDRFMNSVRVE